MPDVKAKVEPLAIVFGGDGLVPNNSMPFLVYKAAVEVGRGHPEETVEKLFGTNGWGDMWRNGVYDYLHYHSTVHEALGVARGHARVRFGGDAGKDGSYGVPFHSRTSGPSSPITGSVSGSGTRGMLFSAFAWFSGVGRVICIFAPGG